jgi:hypothetical protein
MTELGDLLERLHRADASFETLDVELSVWSNWDLQRRAAINELDESRRALAEAATKADPGGAGASDLSSTVRLWIEQPNRLREERDGFAADDSLVVRDGATWWWVAGAHGVMTNAGNPNQQHPLSAEARLILHGSQLLVGLEFTVLGRRHVAGREVQIARGTRRPGPLVGAQLLFSVDFLGRYAHEFELCVDLERGLVLRAESRWDGQPLSIIEVVRIVVDEPIDPERFVFEVPEGQVPKTNADLFREVMRELPLHEAASAAPFTVLVPQRVPADWRLTVRVHGLAGRPGLTPTVLMSYTTPDGSAGVNLSQTGPEAPDTFDMPGGPHPRHLVRDGVQMRIRERQDNFPQTQLACEHHGTQVTMNSDSLDVDTLATLAASLAPAATTPPTI